MTAHIAASPDDAVIWKTARLDAPFARAIEAQWSDLAQHAIEKNIFLYPWFIIPSLPLLAKHTPQIVTIYAGDLLIGLLMVRSDFGYAKLPLYFARTALHHEQYLATPLVRQGYAAQFASGLCAWLDDRPSRDSFLMLSWVTGNSEIQDAILATCADQQRQCAEFNRFERAAIGPVQPNIALAKAESLLSSNRRKSLMRSRKSLSALGALSIEKLSRQEQVADWLDDFLTMENSGWKRENRSSILSSADETALYRQMVASAFDQGHLHFFRLCLAGKAIAYTLDIIALPHAYCLKSAFDQAYKKYAPGVLMEFETLQYYYQHGDFDLVDSCTAPDNAMLNSLWPDRKPIVDLAIARKGGGHQQLFAVMVFLKKWQLKLKEGGHGQ